MFPLKEDVFLSKNNMLPFLPPTKIRLAPIKTTSVLLPATFLITQKDDGSLPLRFLAGTSKIPRASQSELSFLYSR